MLVFCTRALLQGTAPVLVRALSSRSVVATGRYSYSLYLIHVPIIVVLHLMLLRLNLTPIATLGLMFAVGVPFALAAAFLFYLVFEKPFVNSPRVARVATRPATLAAIEEATA
jgi:peptidoglycan/LPS O-acetylase OafA/YrhL